MMRCIVCGNILPPGAAQCPVCGAGADAAQNEARYPNGGYGFAAGNAQNAQNRYATPAFHTYRKQMLTGFPQNQEANYQGKPRDGFSAGSALVRALSDLPQLVRGAFSDPMGTLQRMVRRDDRLTGGIMVLLSLILAFLTGMIMTGGVLGTLFSAMSGLTGLQLADSAASLNQGVGYLAGKIALPVGGIAALCQLIAALVPVVVVSAYLNVLKQQRFSYVLVSGLTAIITLPNALAFLLAAVFSLITPYLALGALFFGQVVSYVLLCNVAVGLADTEPARTVQVQASLICFSELLKIVLIAVVGGAMMSGVVQTLAGLTSSVSGLL